MTNKATKEVQTYVGLTENTFKTRYLNHTSSFRNKTKRNATELSKHIWKLKDSNASYTINWKIIKKSQPYSNKTKRCNLCMSEKFIIICHPELSSLNKRNELISTCRHWKNFYYDNTLTRTCNMIESFNYASLVHIFCCAVVILYHLPDECGKFNTCHTKQSCSK